MAQPVSVSTRCRMSKTARVYKIEMLIRNRGHVSFQALLDDTRSQIAKQLLHDTRSPVSRIAASLGYRDPTVFTRAFRRWTGLTPRQFRAALPDKW